MAYNRNRKTGKREFSKRTLLLIIIAIAVVAAVLLIVFLKPGGNGASQEQAGVTEAEAPTIGPDTSVVPATEIPISDELLAELEAGEAGNENVVSPQDGVETDYKTAFADPATYRNNHVEFTGTLLEDAVNNQGLLAMNLLVDGEYYVFVNYLDMDETMNFKAGDEVTVAGVVLNEAAVDDADGNAQNGVMVSAESIQ